MKKVDFTVTISVRNTPEEAFAKIAQVGNWWAKSFEGRAIRSGDSFRIVFGKTWVCFQITEAVPAKKIIWQVSDSYLHWLNDKTEWNGTQILWEIFADGDSTSIKMTHLGLNPDLACYENCKMGWTRFVTLSLPKFIEEGIGLPE